MRFSHFWQKIDNKNGHVRRLRDRPAQLLSKRSCPRRFRCCSFLFRRSSDGDRHQENELQKPCFSTSHGTDSHLKIRDRASQNMLVVMNSESCLERESSTSDSAKSKLFNTALGSWVRAPTKSWEEGERRERNKRKRQPGRTGAGQRGEWQLNEQREEINTDVEERDKYRR